jgi:DNA-binding cell septation regulator SpoVG
MFSITETRITLALPEHEPLVAYCDFILDCSLIVKGFRIIRRRSGLFLVAPSRKRMTSCAACAVKNPLKNAFCGHCGRPLPVPASDTVFHVETAHPLSRCCWRLLEEHAYPAYQKERQKAHPRMVMSDDDFDIDDTWLTVEDRY